ncbi:hypothetical protein G6N74_28465 [Mesorhizobium sp. CGMCC 1.15528]|uniref:Uncharacterized protein n=1 Tax=Mesorhizobium zhangyense TaxID=1776730 RepID=A0A7C9RBW1_9HYPH|nr:hypothetical protein [Mesorhizobium zhangyense]NGN44995.1 hypothetical protein [Mesorhizobium zhangyense]
MSKSKQSALPSLEDVAASATPEAEDPAELAARMQIMANYYKGQANALELRMITALSQAEVNEQKVAILQQKLATLMAFVESHPDAMVKEQALTATAAPMQ